MNGHASGRCLLWLLGLAGACSREPAHVLREEEPPPITVRVEPAPHGLKLDSARRIPAPPVRFSALLDPDLNHPTAVTAGQRGRLRWVRPRAEVAPRESLAVGVAPGGGGAKVFRVLAEREGTWWPRAQAGDDVWPYDIVGLAQPHGLALAVGVVPDYDAEFVHTGDSAMVRFPDRSEPPHRGRVERVRYPE
ncbi:MAG: hypothetical protein HYW06_04700, partial [Gemmatimonadetes bacterium]|nr:hypothetical protein [Gemmatimonadota bacterium]